MCEQCTRCCHKKDWSIQCVYRWWHVAATQATPTQTKRAAFPFPLAAVLQSANICLKQASYKPQYIHLFSYKMLYWYMQCTHARSTCIQNIYLCLSATNPLVYFKFHEFFRNIFLKLFDIYFHTNCVCFSIDNSFVWHRFPCENALKHTHTNTSVCA